MPYILWKKNGKRSNLTTVFTSRDLENLRKNSKGVKYQFLNITTRRMKTIKT